MRASALFVPLAVLFLLLTLLAIQLERRYRDHGTAYQHPNNAVFGFIYFLIAVALLASDLVARFL